MYSYIKGIISEVHREHVVIDNQGIGYHIFVAHPEDFRSDTEVKVYVYSQIKEDSNKLFGFLHKEEKKHFF